METELQQELLAQELGIDYLTQDEQANIITQLEDAAHERLLLYITQRLPEDVQENFATMCAEHTDEILFEFAAQHIHDLDVLMEQTTAEIFQEFTKEE